MNRTPVSSSMIASIGYDVNAQRLEVEFKRGAVYEYFEVPEEIYLNLLSAESVGKYFDAAVKKGGYGYAQIQ